MLTALSHIKSLAKNVQNTQKYHLCCDDDVNAQEMDADVDEYVEDDGRWIGPPLLNGPAEQELEEEGVGDAEAEGPVQGQRHHCVQQDEYVQVE